ncbi:MAG: ATP-binding protein [Acidobacteriota bacterium]
MDALTRELEHCLRRLRGEDRLTAQVELSWRLREYDPLRSRSLAEQVERLSHPSSPRLVLASRVVRAVLLALEGDGSKVLGLLDGVEDDPNAEPKTRVRAAYARGCGHRLLGEAESALTAIRQVRERSVELSSLDLELEVGLLLLEAWAERYLGRNERARELGERARTLTLDHDLRALQPRCFLDLSRTLGCLGNDQERVTLQLAALEQLRQSDPCGELARAEYDIALTLSRGGRQASALEHCRACLALATRPIDRLLRVTTLGLMGELLRSDGRYEEALQTLESALAEDVLHELSPQRMATRAALAMTLVDLGRPDEALHEVEEILAKESSPSVAILEPTLQVKGRALLDLDRPDEARVVFEQASELVAGTDFVQRWPIQDGLATALEALGESELAARHRAESERARSGIRKEASGKRLELLDVTAQLERSASCSGGDEATLVEPAVTPSRSPKPPRPTESAEGGLDGRLATAERMEFLGRVASGLTHDFNNLLQVIQGHASELVSTTEDDDTRRSAEAVLEAAEQGARLTAQLMSLGQRAPVRRSVLDLNEVVQRTLLLGGCLLPDEVTLETSLGRGLGPVLGDAIVLEQALLNLILNARDAMPNGGQLRVATSRGRGVSEERESDFRQVTVTDTGCGMTKEVLARCFEPFYTTKESGQGSGLGLASVLSSLEALGGTIEARSEPDRGSVFTISIPSAAAVRLEERAVDPSPKETVEWPTRVLVVDDEDAVRKVVARMLEAQGIEVVEAADGAAALTMFEEANEFDVVLTDVSMPGFGGLELVRRLLDRDASCAFLLMSGRSVPPHSDDRVLDSSEVLPKPFTADDLRKALKRSMARRVEASS